MKSRFEMLWNAFVEQQRRARAPEELHRRVRAAIREAAAAGSWGEMVNTKGQAGRDVTAVARRASGGDVPR